MWGVVFKTIERLSRSLAGSTPAGSRQFAALVFISSVSWSAVPEWSVAQNPHITVYSQAGKDRTQSTLRQFEQLRLFFLSNPIAGHYLASESTPGLRVVEFASANEYEAVKLRPNADAYYTSDGERDYIVMPVFSSGNLAVAAHEYAHFVLNSGGLQLPAWLSEGLAERMSTVAFTNKGCELGGSLPARAATLRRHPWLTASELMATSLPALKTREASDLFYSESWALTDLLVASETYAPRFGNLVKLLNSGLTGPDALTQTYAMPVEAILNDAREWVRSGRSPRVKSNPLLSESVGEETYPLTGSPTQLLMADLLLTSGSYTRAGQIYESVLRESPPDQDPLTALDNYRYATLSDLLNHPAERVAQALEKAVALDPSFDKARYKLAQLYSNQSNYAAALVQLQAMHSALPGKIFGYWALLASAMGELGRRDESVAAAELAMRFAGNSAEYASAKRLAYIAQTDLGVGFRRDVDGTLKLETKRIPHGATGINPFVEAEDHLETASGQLREVQCKADKLTGFIIARPGGLLTLLVTDPTRVLIRNGPSEFSCGVQTDVAVKVEFALTTTAGSGVLRGMDFGVQSGF